MRDPEQVARAQHAAARLESAWERWRSLQGLADTPAQPVVGYVGYALKEPWGQPRAVIGFSADEAERLAEFLEHGNSEGQQPAQIQAAAAPQPAMQSTGAGPQPKFTPQPTFTPQAAAPPVAPPPPPAAPRQAAQRSAQAPAPSQPSPQQRGGHRKNVSKLTSSRAQSASKTQQADGPEPGAAAEAPQGPLHTTAIPEQPSRADLAADRSLRAS
jgi:hypothetical protein